MILQVRFLSRLPVINMTHVTTKKQQIKENLGKAVELIRETGLVYPAAKYLNIKQATLVKYLNEAGVDYHKFLRQRGFTLTHSNEKVPIEDYLSGKKNINAAKLRVKLISEGLKEAKCEICGRSRWMKKQIPLELHHINGDHHDNHLENLMVVCSNCHSQKHGYSNFGTDKIKGEYKKEYRKKTQSNKENVTTLCCDCGRTISSGSSRCRKCEHIKRLRNNSSYDPLAIIRSVQESGSFLKAAEQFNVSANALVKFLKKRGYPYHTKDVKAFPLPSVN